MKDLQATRERGFAISLQEHETGINAAAAPVLDPSVYPVAAVAVAGPSFRLTPERMLEIGSLVHTVADSIGEEVGSIHAWGTISHGA